MEVRIHVEGTKRVRVSGPQVAANKRDRGDRPCMWLFVDGEEYLCHEVKFHGATRIVQDFGDGEPSTGAIIWIETDDPVTTVLRTDRRTVFHDQAVKHDPLLSATTR